MRFTVWILNWIQRDIFQLVKNFYQDRKRIQFSHNQTQNAAPSNNQSSFFHRQCQVLIRFTYFQCRSLKRTERGCRADRQCRMLKFKITLILTYPSFCQNACSPQSCANIHMAGEFWEVNAAAIICPVASHASQYGNIKGVSRRSQWPRGRRSAAACLLRLWVHIPPGAWMFVSCESCVLSGTDLIDELITRPEESYRMWCVVVCDLET
jgi:hypothetical protein